MSVVSNINQEVELKVSSSSDWFTSERETGLDTKIDKKNRKKKSATRGVQVVYIGIPTISLYNLVPNLIIFDIDEKKIQTSQTFLTRP